MAYDFIPVHPSGFSFFPNFHKIIGFLFWCLFVKLACFVRITFTGFSSMVILCERNFSEVVGLIAILYDTMIGYDV